MGKPPSQEPGAQINMVKKSVPQILLQVVEQTEQINSANGGLIVIYDAREIA